MEDENKQDAQLDENEQESEDSQEEEQTDEESSEDNDDGDVDVLKDKLSKTAKELHELREWKKRQLKRQKEVKPKPADDVQSIREELEDIKLKQLRPDLADEDIKEIRIYAKGAGITILQALQNPIFKAGIEQVVAQRKAEEAMPKGKKRSVSGVDVSTLDLDNPEDIKLLRENPDLKKKFMEQLKAKR